MLQVSKSYFIAATGRVPFRIGTGSEAGGNHGSTQHCWPKALESSGLYAFTRKRIANDQRTASSKPLLLAPHRLEENNLVSPNSLSLPNREEKRKLYYLV